MHSRMKLSHTTLALSIDKHPPEGLLFKITVNRYVDDMVRVVLI